MSAIDFHTIRPIRGSANNGFEELCCQLVACENTSPEARFIRNGTPDGGVECYWTEPDGSEQGWQAKWFFELERSQWQQLDDSVMTALGKHPGLTRYTICLPIDLPDARVPDQQSLRQKWDARVQKWEAAARSRGMTVSFGLWGQSQLLMRLTIEKHAGRRWFWFRQVELSPTWLANHLDEVVAAAGPRYTRELNVSLPVAERFDALGYTAAFRERLAGACTKCTGAYLSLGVGHHRPEETEELRKAHADLAGTWETLRLAFDAFGDSPPKRELASSISRLIHEAREAAGSLDSMIRKFERGRTASTSTADSSSSTRAVRSSDGESYLYRQFRSALDALSDFLEAASAELAGQPALLLAGDAGSGKTHLLCDVAVHRLRAGFATVVLLGQQFERGDVWSQIITRLGLDATRDEFLGALDSIGEASGCRTLLFIDAINEAVDVRWGDELPAMLTILARYPHVGLAISCRTTYESLLVREDLQRNGHLSRVEHDGFAPRLFEALRAFCHHYRIETLNTPPLDPEFQNPLFLKLFCQGLHNRGLTRPPTGHNGFQRVFSFLLDSVNEKLSAPTELDFPADEPIVHRAVDAVADAMFYGGRYSIPRAEAQTILEAILPRAGQGYSRSLLRKLIAEGILTDDFVRRKGAEGKVLVVRFAYERFADYQLARRLLDQHAGSGNVEAAFVEGGRLRRILSDDRAYGRRGLLAAMTVLVPERFGREVGEFLPELWVKQTYRDGFLEALPWREARHITPATLRFVEQLLSDSDNTSSLHAAADAVFDRLVQLIARPEHPLNARWLHRRLAPMTMAERDLEWSTFLHRTHTAKPWKKPSAVERLLDWAWQDNAEFTDPCAGFDDEVVSLACLTVTWCLTTSNRFIRDRATKALVHLLEHRLRLIPDLLNEFTAVADPYLVERLYAAIYGAVMRCGDRDTVGVVAKAVYRIVFADGRPPAHILLRDYARGVIEYALHMGCVLEIDLALPRPPYRSNPLPDDLPSWKELAEKYGGQAYGSLTFSLAPSMGDFARYVLGSDSYDQGLHTWTDQPDPFEKVRELAEKRIELPQQLAMRRWEVTGRDYLTTEMLSNVITELDDADEDSSLHVPLIDVEAFQREVAAREVRVAQFVASLTEEDRNLLARHDAVEKQWLEAHKAAQEVALSYHGASDYSSRWILTRVIELGWTPERFAAFDRNVHQYDGRESRKSERIGKKYQWIAYHELAARTFDHRPFHYSAECRLRYEGPWQMSFRDIDPSLLVRLPPTDEPAGTCWWQPLRNPLCSVEEMSDREWLVHRGSIPDLSPLLSVSQPATPTAWYTLSGYGEWKESEFDREKRRGSHKRYTTFSCGAFLVPSSKAAEVSDALRDFEWTGMDISARDYYDGFLGEYFWSPSYHEFTCDTVAELDGPADYNNSQLRWHQSLPVALASTALRYCHSGHDLDCSASESISGHVPSVWLARRMGLLWSRRRFAYLDRTGRVVAYDPSHEEGRGPHALLSEREATLRFLQESRLALIWLVIGEKLLVGGSNRLAKEDRPVIEVFRQAYSVQGDHIVRVLRTACPLGAKPKDY